MMSDNWDDIAAWWSDAVRDDPAQSDEPLEILSELIKETSGPTIDLGCGEGQAMRLVGGPIVGTDLSRDLLSTARSAGPVVQAQLPDLSWARNNSFGLAISVGLLDLIPDHHAFFLNVAEVVRHRGHLVLVMNHPVSTSPRSEPLSDPEGEILWRWGDYLNNGSWTQSAGDRIVHLVHRPMNELLTAAAQAGWILDRMIERGPSNETLKRFPDFHGQANIPTLLGLRWTNNST
jgi:SAM-dependent methyltransferase